MQEIEEKHVNKVLYSNRYYTLIIDRNIHTVHIFSTIFLHFILVVHKIVKSLPSLYKRSLNSLFLFDGIF